MIGESSPVRKDGSKENPTSARATTLPPDQANVPYRLLAHVPAGLDLAELLPRAWVDYASWVIGRIAFRKFRCRGHTPESWVPLANEFLRDFIPTRVWPKIRDRLVDAAVLEWDRYYRPPTRDRDGKCYHFRLAEPYRTAPLAPYQLRHPELVNRIRRYNAGDRAKVTDPVHVALRRWVERLEVLPGHPTGCPALDHVAAGDCWFIADEQGRLHSPATNVPREYRRFLRLAGHELVAVDVSCSQPLLLAAALTAPTAKAKHHPPPPVPIVVQDSGVRLSDDGYAEDARLGLLYDRLAKVWGTDRDGAKLGFMVTCYGYPRKYDRVRAAAFADLYPATWGRLTAVAGRLPVGGLARLMQRAESDLMIGRAARRFLREFPDVPVLTCHDALLVPAGSAPAAERIIYESWHAEYGIGPMVKVSHWTE